MAYIHYQQPFQTPAQLVQKLQNDGLNVQSVAAAERVLKQVNYFRFKAYLHPFLDPATQRYKPGSQFTDGVELYRFDSELRAILAELICDIEVAIRAKLDHCVAGHLSDPFWYLDRNLFRKKIDGTLNKIHTGFIQTRDEFANNFKTRYTNDKCKNYKHLPPFWIAAELTTFGDLIVILDSLDKNPFAIGPRQNILDDMSAEVGAANLAELNNWMVVLRNIRNKCAHHARLWNANLAAPGGVLNKLTAHPDPRRRNKLYLSLTVFAHMSRHIDVAQELTKDVLLDLFAKYPAADRLKASMGFPANWETDPFWV